jgi:hypothetical protein
MLCPKNGSGYSLYGICVEFLQPRRLEEHDFGHVLNLACDDNVALKGDNITGSRNANEVIGGTSCDCPFVITEKDLANEHVWAQFDRSFENDSSSSRAEQMIVLVSDKVIWQDVQADSDGDTIQVVHKASDWVVGNNGSNPIILDIELESSRYRHCEGAD